jgi:hypothetical protein
MKLTSILFTIFLLFTSSALAVDLTKCTIVYDSDDYPLVAKMANTLANDIWMVTDQRPAVSTSTSFPALHSTSNIIVLGTQGRSSLIDAQKLNGSWECYSIRTDKNRIVVCGSDPRGLAYGVLHISEKIGVSPWYWFADVPVRKIAPGRPLNYSENIVSQPPTIKYRGIFINDEDWGLKTWSATTFEKELNDIGPKTYDKVCELILRLKGNMLAPAMHSCTGAFYSHPESQQVAAEWGIMITTSHCEPMLFNNAAESEWSKERDGEWNYLTNKEVILQKFHNRLRETAAYDNIYTTGMRGLHDEAMKGSTDPKVRARTLEQVFAAQRQILEKYKQKVVTSIPQIFVPYKETLDIYDAGLEVPEDITLVWPDDNYGYMKRVSNGAERKRSGGSGVYYHLSYLGAPHDHLWVSTMAPALMYEELRKAYDSGADRYWLLNVGDIKPMEIEMQQFFDMAWNFSAFSYDNVNRYQACWLASVFGKKYQKAFQNILDTYYRLAWQRKPEYMGYEMEWDSQENSRLHDTDFSFADGTAQQRLTDYKRIAEQCQQIHQQLPADYQPAFFEMLSYAVNGAYQMNRKFLMAQRNHETGSQADADESRQAFDAINALTHTYNTLLDGKWNQMMSEIPPGYTAKYHLMPELTGTPTTAYQLPKAQLHPNLPNVIELNKVKLPAGFRRFSGMGMDWTVIQMGNPFDAVQNPQSLSSAHIDIPFTTGESEVEIQITVVPLWPVSADRSNRIGVSVDGARPVVCENIFKEWGPEWKLQVLENRKDFYVTFPLTSGSRHILTLIVGDPGQIVQRIAFR